MKIDLKNYLEKVFECPECHWKGKGKELDIENFSELHFIIDFECPKCFNHIGSGQSEIIDVDKNVKYIKGEIIDAPSFSNIYNDNQGKSINILTHKNEIKLEYSYLEKNSKILKTIKVSEADKVCLAFNCHRNDLEESLIHLLFKKQNAFDIFKDYLLKNRIKFISLDKINP